jgi:hypothetical protein
MFTIGFTALLVGVVGTTALHSTFTPKVLLAVLLGAVVMAMFASVPIVADFISHKRTGTDHQTSEVRDSNIHMRISDLILTVVLMGIAAMALLVAYGAFVG